MAKPPLPTKVSTRTQSLIAKISLARRVREKQASKHNKIVLQASNDVLAELLESIAELNAKIDALLPNDAELTSELRAITDAVSVTDAELEAHLRALDEGSDNE